MTTQPASPYWIETYSGKQFYFDSPSVDMVDIRDIAWALSHVCRYTGHTSTFYSVAEHSMLVASIVPQQDKLWGLLHDGSEAYGSDINAPLKRLLPDYQLVESRIMGVIRRKFNLSLEMPQSVREADMRILHNEKAVLFPKSRNVWNVPGSALTGVYISGMEPQRAFINFIRMYNQLTGENEPIYVNQ